MKTIGRRIPASVSRSDYPALCDYCGTPWYRSQLRKDGAGKLACPFEGDGLDEVTLGQIEAKRSIRQPRDVRAREGTFPKEDPFREDTVHLTEIDPGV